MKTMREIREAADMAETFPGSGVLNWGEMNMQAFCDWVAQVAPQDVGTDHPVGVFDVESVQGMFDCWWRDGVCKARKPAILFNCPHCGKQIPTPEEADLFRLAGVKWIKPELRNVQVAP